MQHVHALVAAFLLIAGSAVLATDKPDCNRPLTLALHDHGLLYSSDTGTGIDKDVADEPTRRSGCKIRISVMPRARIWQLIESGALDFSLSGITNAERDRFAGFAWYFANKYYLLVRKDAGVADQAAAAGPTSRRPSSTRRSAPSRRASWPPESMRVTESPLWRPPASNGRSSITPAGTPPRCRCPSTTPPPRSRWSGS